MRKTEIVADLVRRHVPMDANPEAKAALYREVVSAVKAAGRHAEAAWLLTQMESGDLLSAFTAQVRALEAPARAPAEPAEPDAPQVRRSSWRPQTVRVRLPREVEI